MARKEEKLRPYRVDYFLIEEMKNIDSALVKSVIVRAVTASDAADSVIQENIVGGQLTPPRTIIVRSYRYYKNLGARKKDVFKAVEDLFTANKAVEVMQQVETYRSYQMNLKTMARQAELEAAQCPYGYPAGPNGTAHTCAIHKTSDYAVESVPVDHTMDYDGGHKTRYSDSSLYDEVCTLCGATDTNGGLNRPCPQAVAPTVQQAVIDVYQTKVPDDVPLPTSGPDSVATQAVVADLDGMTNHDKHEQLMDSFTVSDPNPPATVRGLGFPDPALPEDWNKSLSFPNAPAGPTQPAVFDGDAAASSDHAVPCEDSEPSGFVITSTGSDASWKEPGMPLWAKLGIFGVVAVSLLLIVNALLNCPGK